MRDSILEHDSLPVRHCKSFGRTLRTWPCLIQIRRCVCVGLALAFPYALTLLHEVLHP